MFRDTINNSKYVPMKGVTLKSYIKYSLLNMSFIDDIFKDIDKGYIKFGRDKVRTLVDTNKALWFNGQDLLKVPKKYKIQLQDIDHQQNTQGIHPTSIYLTESGMYKLVLTSKLPAAEKILQWLNSDILPSIRKYGNYTTIKESKKTIRQLETKISSLIKEIRDDCNNQCHTKGMVYAIDCSTEDAKIFKIGITYDKIQNVVHIVFSICPQQFELCVKFFLYDFRYVHNGRIKKGYYKCSKEHIKKVMKKCVEELKPRNSQTGGSKRSFVPVKSPFDILTKKWMNESSMKIKRLEKKIRDADKMMDEQ